MAKKLLSESSSAVGQFYEAVCGTHQPISAIFVNTPTFRGLRYLELIHITKEQNRNKTPN
jgi:hypothetical protein